MSTGEINLCTIAGLAGPIHKLSSKLKIELHEFLSCLFTTSELRGRDAAGFWVWRKDHYVFEKRPTPAEDLIERSPRWKGLRFNPGSLYLLHTRAATDGDPNENMNNHPHLGEHSVMIHNGMIWGHNSIASQFGLNMKTDCDSEVLLRLAEYTDDIEEGLKFMYETASDSNGLDSIATAFVDRRNPNRILLSRNSGSPCYIYKSERFGCTFFVSTEIIFERALEMLYDTKNPKIIGAKSENVPTNWLYSLYDDGSVKKNFLVSPTSKSTYFGTQHSYDDIDDITTEPEQEYIYVHLDNVHEFTINISGKMSSIKLELENDDELELEFIDPVEMPKEEVALLRGFLDAKINEGGW